MRKKGYWILENQRKPSVKTSGAST